MAYAFRIADDSRVFIRGTFAFPPDDRHRYSILIGETSFALSGAFRHEDIVVLENAHFAFERALFKAGQNIPRLLVTDCQSQALLALEPIGFAPSFFMPFFDLAKSIDMPPYALGSYRKPELLAVFTHVYNDLDGLRMWQRHYAHLVPHRHLYVVDHGSTYPYAEVLHPETRVVAIPRGEVDHLNIAQFCAYFQRFLLTQYRWVIHVDSDELLVHRHGFAALLERLERDGTYGPIVRPAQAFDLLDHTDGHAPLDGATPMSLQRHLLSPAPEYRKPVLGAVPTSWSIGFHQALEDVHVMDDPDLWLIHARYADLQLATRRESRWIGTPQSLSDKTFVPQDGRCASIEGLVAKIERECARDRSVMPDWMRGAF